MIHMCQFWTKYLSGHACCTTFFLYYATSARQTLGHSLLSSVLRCLIGAPPCPAFLASLSCLLAIPPSTPCHPSLPCTFFWPSFIPHQLCPIPWKPLPPPNPCLAPLPGPPSLTLWTTSPPHSPPPSTYSALPLMLSRPSLPSPIPLLASLFARHLFNGKSKLYIPFSRLSWLQKAMTKTCMHFQPAG